jgi:pimeloyl-ACP methyl ester carboxylesterase
MHLKVEKLSIIAHSALASTALAFGALFPENIKVIVDLDGRIPFSEPHEISVEFLKFLKRFKQAEERNQLKFKISFTLDELSEKYSAATSGSVTKDVAPYILKRSIQKCENSEKFHFIHDNCMTLQTVSGLNLFQKFPEAMAKRINFPLLTIECTKNPFMGMKTFHGDVLDILKENENFEYHLIDETHHVHLTEPEKVSRIISKFILKHG